MRPRDGLIKNWEVKWYLSTSGRNPVKDFLLGLEKDQRDDFNKHLKLLLQFGPELSMPHAKEVKRNKPLWELRPAGFRVIYVFYSGDYFLLLHAFPKKRWSIPARHIKTAFRRLHDWEERYGG
jgi:phage-related protein